MSVGRRRARHGESHTRTARRLAHRRVGDALAEASAPPGAPPLAGLSEVGLLTAVEAQDGLRLASSTRVTDQGSALHCSAHAFVAAMETWLVQHGRMAAGETLLEPLDLFKAMGSFPSSHRARNTVAKGVPGVRGVVTARCSFPVARQFTALVDALRQGSVLVSDLKVGENFQSHTGPAVYRLQGAVTAHSICILGFGRDPVSHEPYWIAKNSYGAAWGEGGYVRVAWGDPAIKPELQLHLVREVLT